MAVVGLVAEGTLDFPVLTAMLEAELPPAFTRPIKFLHIQPKPDASTAGKYFGGGWGRVVGWCLKNSGNLIETYFTPLEEEDTPCDLIVLHLDGDAMRHCVDHCTVNAPDEPCHITDRLATMDAIVLDLLKPTSARAAQIKCAFPTMHTEAWMMAALKPDERDWEGEADAKTPFQALKASGGKGSMQDFYKAKAVESASKTADIRRQCASFAHFQAALIA